MIDKELARRITTAARKGREWQQRRDALIIEAVDNGASQAEVARLAGLSQAGVHYIATAGRRGVYWKRQRR